MGVWWGICFIAMYQQDMNGSNIFDIAFHPN